MRTAGLIDDTIDFLSHELAQRIGREDAAALARDVVARMCAQWGGGTMYFPRGISLARVERDARIRAEFSGTNYFELARRHGLSEMSVRRIVKQEPK